jgi:N6-adenosine-specific RNA methylase IME4
MTPYFTPIVDSDGNRVSKPGDYDIVLTDPPWPYYGDPNKNAAAGKHYDLMSMGDLKAMPVRDELAAKSSALFMWATSPMMDRAIDLIRAWGYHYRGVVWVWVKTRKDGQPIHGQGVPPTFTKPTTEYVLGATTKKRGRAWPIQTSSMPQVIFEPRGAHSAKPKRFHRLIEELAGPERSMVELHCRGRPEEGWHGWGNECLPKPGKQSIKEFLLSSL